MTVRFSWGGATISTGTRLPGGRVESTAESASVDGVGRLATDPELRARLGEAGRRRASTRPTWEQSAELFFAAIRGALGS